MSSVTPSTAFTVSRARPKIDPPADGKWTLRSLIAINGLSSLSIILRLSTRHKPRSRNGRANDARALVARTADIHFGRYPRRVHSAARTDTPAASAPDPAAVPESDRGFPAPPKGRALNAGVRACTDCRVARKSPRSAPAQTPSRHT